MLIVRGESREPGPWADLAASARLMPYATVKSSEAVSYLVRMELAALVLDLDADDLDVELLVGLARRWQVSATIIGVSDGSRRSQLCDRVLGAGDREGLRRVSQEISMKEGASS